MQIIELIDGKRVYHRQVCACNALAGCTHPGHSPDTVTAPRVSAAACVCRACAHVGANRHGRVQDVHEVQGARVLRVRLSSLSTPLQDKPPPPSTTGDHRHPRACLAVARGSDCGGSRVWGSGRDSNSAAGAWGELSVITRTRDGQGRGVRSRARTWGGPVHRQSSAVWRCGVCFAEVTNNRRLHQRTRTCGPRGS